MRKETKSHHPFLLPGRSFTPIFSTSSPVSSVWGQGMGVVVNSPHVVSVTPSSSLSLPQSEVPPVGHSCPWTSPMRVLHTGCSSSWTAPAWFLPMGCSPSGTDCSSMGHKSASKAAPAWVPLSSPVHRYCQEPAPAQASFGVSVSFRYIHLLQCVVLHRLQVDVCSIPELHGLQGDSLPHQGLPASCRRISAPARRSPPPLPSSLTWVSAELFLSHILTPLSWMLFHNRVFSPAS